MASRSHGIALIGALVSPVVVLAACGSDGATDPIDDAGTVLDAATTPLLDGAAEDAQEGDGGETSSSAIVEISAGNDHACARRASGRVSCWGHNVFGMLGNGQEGSAGVPHLPQVVTGLEDAVQISAGHNRTCARRANGTVACWGSYGSIANGATTNVLVPTTIVSSIEAGTPFVGAEELGARWHGYTCARRANGTATCWGGDNGSGRNGDGTTAGRNVPGVDVVGLTDAVELAKGESHACARRAAGTVVCWGLNVNGQLGTGSTVPVQSSVPVSVMGITDATELGVGQSQTCVRHQAGTVSCWGVNLNGQLGNGTKVLNSPTPTAVSDLNDATRLVGGSSHFCALRESGSVVCWGSNTYGQLGDGTKDEHLSPNAVSELTDAVEITAGSIYTCARRATGAVVCWGSNTYGQLGDGTKGEHLTPSAVVGL